MLEGQALFWAKTNMGEGTGITYHIRAQLEAFGRNKTQAKMRRFATNFERVGASIRQAGRNIGGTFASTAASAAKIGVAIAGIAGAYGLGKMVKSSVAFNEQMETAEGAIASTTQLFGFFDNAKFPKGMSDAQKSASRFQMNLKMARGEMDRIFDIAAKSPATFEEGMKFYQNMLPGAAGITRDMNRIRDLYRKGLSVGIITGGDFKVAGQQMGRILKGGAGAEFDVWKTLEQPILKTGKNMKLFGAAVTEANVTKKFNELAAIDRLRLVEEALKDLGATTDFWASSWVGLKSTIISIGQLFQRAFGDAIFKSLKERMKRIVLLLDPEKNTFKRLEDGFAVWGKVVAGPIDHVLSWAFVQIDHISNNWQTMSVKLIKGFETFLHAAKIMLKVAVMRAAVGAGVQGVGMAVQAGGAAKNAVSGIINVMRAAGPAAPAVAALAAAMAGLSVVFGGVVVHWIDNWDKILGGFRTGAIEIRPLFQALADLWAKFSALGGAFLGTSSATGQMQSAINIATSVVLGLTKALEYTVRVGGYAAVLIENMARIFAATLGGMVTMTARFAQAIMMTLKETIGRIPGVNLEGAYASTAGAADFASNFTKEALKGMGFEGTVGQRMLQGADAFAAASAKLEDSGMLASFYKALQEREADKLLKNLMQGLDPAPDPNQDLKRPPKGNQTNIYKMNVIQDLRNHDPDRIIGAFKKAVNDSVRKRVAASTGVAGAH